MQIRPDNVRVFEPSAVAPAPCSGGTAPTGAATSKVQVSGHAQRLAELHRTVESSDEVRADRVAELQARVQNGTYQVDLEGLASLLAERLS